MASLGDLTLFVSAETDRAQKDIQSLGKEADKVSGKRRNVDFNFKNAKSSVRQFKRDIEDVGKATRTALQIAAKHPGFQEQVEKATLLADKTQQIAGGLNEARKPAKLLQRSFSGLAGGAISVVNSMAKVGAALYGLQQITGALQSTFGGLFRSTVGESVKLQENILKTQTALASTNDVLVDGKAITDPYKAIVTLTGTIEDRIDSIRIKSLDLAGVTSGEVIEVFGMVAQQVGAIGGSLEEAEDLAISFAGALGTFGIPLYQARQEIGSILRGDITMDSYLAKALGITNEDVAKAKTSTEGVIGFLEDKLSVAVAGQAIAAKSFSGVTSNIRDFGELMGEAFGKPLVQPLIDSLTRVYDLLISVKDQALGTATAFGSALAGASSILGGNLRGTVEDKQTRDSRVTTPGQIAAGAQAEFASVGRQIKTLAAEIQVTFTNVTLLIVQTFAKIGAGLKDLAAGFASLQVEVFKNIFETFENILAVVQPLVSELGGLFSMYGDFLQLPIVEYFAKINAQFKLLETIGVASLTKLIVVLVATGFKVNFLGKTIRTVGAFVKGFVSAALTSVGTALQGFGVALQAMITKLGLVNPQLALFASQLQNAGAKAQVAGTNLGTMQGSAKMLGATIFKIGLNFLKFNAILLLVNFAVTAVVDKIAQMKKEAKEKQAIEDMDKALDSLNTSLKNVSDSSSSFEKAMKEMAEAKASAGITLLKKQLTETNDELEKAEKNLRRMQKQSEEDVKRGLGTSRGSVGRANEQKNIERLAALKLKQETKLRDTLDKRDTARTEAQIKQEVSTRSKRLGQVNEKLAKQQEALAKSVADKEFSVRMQLQRKENEVFLSKEQLRIAQIEQGNTVRLKGEEGAAAAFLNGLNNYLANKERGELDIEAKRREQVIATNELEKAIKDYALEIQKKVKELVKQGAKLQKDAADYALLKAKQAKNLQSGGASGTTSQIGAASGLENLIAVKESFGGNYGAFNRGGKDEGHTSIKPGIDNSLPSKSIREIMSQQALPAGHDQVLHAVGKYQIIAKTLKGLMDGNYGETGVSIDDQFSPDVQDRLFLALAKNRVVAGDVQATMKGLRQEWVGLTSVADQDLLPAVQQLMGFETNMANVLTPPDTSAIEAAQRSVNQLNGELIDLSVQSQELRNEQALGELIKNIAPDIAVKNIQDANEQMRQLIQTTMEGGDPAKAEILATARAKEADAVLQLEKALKGADKVATTYGVSVEELQARVREGFYGSGGTLEQLTEEKQLLLDQLAIRQEMTAIQGLTRDSRNNALKTNQNLIMGQAGMQAGTQFDLFEKNRSLAEGRIESRRLEEEQRIGGPLTGKVLENFNKFKDQELVNADKMAEMEGLQQRFQQLGEIASGVGSAISTAFTQGFADILSGAASVQDVLGNMFKGIADSFMQMATKIIADMIKMMVLKSLLGLFGGGSMPGDVGMGQGNLQGGAAQSGMFGLEKFGTLGPNFGLKLAKGGIVTGPTQALIGEGGMNEAVVPLPNGKAIPIDFGKKGKMGGDTNTNITVNVDQSGNSETSTTGDQAGKLGKAIDGAVKRVIMEERRSGGLLHNGRR